MQVEHTHLEDVKIITPMRHGDALGPDGAFVEDTPNAPNSPYAASKASSDHLVRAWHATYGLSVLFSNCSNNFDPRQSPENLIPLVIGKAQAGQPVPVYDQEPNVRDWRYVEVHASALLQVLEQGAVGRSYNIGGNAERSNLAPVRTLCALLDLRHPPGAPHADLIHFVTDRPGHDFRYPIDASRTRDELGWTPPVTLDQGLADTMDWHLSRPDWTSAAQHRVDGAETAEVDATLVNAPAPGTMAQAAANRDLPVVHISTDNVFDGRGDTAFEPTDRPAPLGVFGRTKLAGEQAVRKANGPDAILRTSWVFSPLGRNFARTMLRLGQTRHAVSVVDEKVGGPTSAAAIAQACMKVAAALIRDPEKTGIYHFLGRPDASRAGFARAVFSQAGIDVNVTPIRSGDYSTHGSLLDAGNFVCTLQKRQGTQTGCPEEIAFEQGWIDADDLRKQAEFYGKNDKGRYLLGLLDDQGPGRKRLMAGHGR